MIWLLKSDQPRPTEFAPAMDESTGILPGLPAVAGKPVHVAFDGGRVTSDAGILLTAIEQRLGIAERLADCIEDPRAPERVRHGLSEMIRYRALLIAAGYPDGNDCDALRADPAFKMAVGRLPESGADLCSQPTISRLENLPGRVALKRMMAAMVEVFCDSFEQVPRRIVLDIDDTEDRVHGGQQLALFNAYYDSRCFQPIHIYEATTGKPVAIILRPGKTPDGAEVTLVLRHVIGHIRARWPTVDIVVRGDSHYARPEAMAWCERKRIGYIFGLAGNPVLLRRVGRCDRRRQLRCALMQARQRVSAPRCSQLTVNRLLCTRCAIYRCPRRPRGRSWLDNHPESGECRVNAPSFRFLGARWNRRTCRRPSSRDKPASRAARIQPTGLPIGAPPPLETSWRFVAGGI